MSMMSARPIINGVMCFVCRFCNREAQESIQAVCMQWQHPHAMVSGERDDTPTPLGTRMRRARAAALLAAIAAAAC